MGLKTPMYEQHVQSGAKIVDFGGWDMPIHYGSQLNEHHQVRRDVGMFDVSHMTVLDIVGSEAKAFLSKLLANDIGKLSSDGRAMYSAMLDDNGGILDDLIVYANGDDYLMVVNCATRQKDIDWITRQASTFNCKVTERPELAIIAVQGPNALEVTSRVAGDAAAQTIKALKVFQGAYCSDWFIARTGYTGEKGVEIVLPAEAAVNFWQAMLAAGVAPIGLGARDTLRLEAGMNLYGSDMDESVTPYESNMASTVVMDEHEFIGKTALEQHLQAGQDEQLISLIMTGRGVLRAHYPVFSGDHQVGEITSGAFSPTLEHAIAFARVNNIEPPLTVEIRGKKMPVQQVQAPFVRNGKQVYKTL